MIPKEIIENIRHVEIKTRRMVNSLFAGEYHSAFKGRGIEFSEVRPYTEGDDIRTIDWNVMARMGEPYVKVHVEERELTTMLVVDASASGEFGSQKRFKSDVALQLCAVLAFSAIKNNDKVGLIMFTDTVEKFVPPKKGKNHVLRLIRELLYFEPSGKTTSIGTAMKFCADIQKKRAVVFCVSDFQCDDYDQPMRMCAQRHDCIAVGIHDPVEMQLPAAGLLRCIDPETEETMLVDTGDPLFRKQYEQSVRARHERMRAFFGRTGIDYIPVHTDGDYVDPLIRFFKRRERIKAAGR